MPVTKTQSQQAAPLTAIALDSTLCVHKKIKMIKGEDGRINSLEEAQAILSIPQTEIRWTDNKEELSFARRAAFTYLKYGDRNLKDDLVDLYNYCIKTGKSFISKYLNSDNSLAKK
mgnify:CR=1 FL=1